jgi:hypothetical protein
VGTCQAVAARNGVGDGSVEDRVAVPPGHGREAGVEGGLDDDRLAHHDGRSDEVVHGPLQGDEVDVGAGVER